MKINAYALQKGITYQQIADTVRMEYPKCSKAAISMAARTQDTGVHLISAAERMIVEAYGPARSHQSGGRTRPYRLQVRVTESELELFNSARGTLSMQDFLHNILMEVLHAGKPNGHV